MSTTEWEQFDEALQRALTGMGLDIDPERRRRMFAHYEQVVEANRHFNLTRITTPTEAAVKHYADSLVLLAPKWVTPDQKLTVLDVGTGAGFPAVPLALVCDNWSILAIDGTGKKVRFVAESASRLGLSNVTARHERVEELARQSHERFDLVLARAVGKIADLLPSLAGVVRPQGSIVFYKTEQADAEVAAADPIAAKLRLALNMHHAELPIGSEILARQLVRYRRSR